MINVVISYSQKDDVESHYGDRPDMIISLFKEQLQEVYRGPDADKLVFMDKTNIKDGDHITDTIEKAIEDCSVMIVFCSPNYFRSQYCFEEWRLFKKLVNEDAEKEMPTKLLIPILYDEIEAVLDDISNIHGDKSREWVTELTAASGRKYSITPELLKDKNKAKELEKHVESLADSILKQTRLYSGVKITNGTGNNILTINSKIESTLKTKPIQNQVLKFKGKFNFLPVCVIYTGGTVGMIKAENSDEYHIDYKMADSVSEIVDLLHPKLSALPFDMHFMGLKSTIDSSNIKSSDWVKLAKIITEQIDNYQGFVILHGANTMAYSASALSFLLDGLPKPVVLTGSEVPLGDSNSDAEHNTINAIRAAAPESKNGPYPIPEVCVFYGNHLFRGNRVTKKHASDRSEGFHTPNMSSVLATLQNERLIVEHSMLGTRHEEVQRLTSSTKISDLSAKIMVLHVYPEINIQACRESIKAAGNVKGIILRSYGPGNTPDDDEFVGFMKELIKTQGIVVVNTTQCQYGKVELKTFETSAKLFDIGVANGGDMTLEAAYCKLMFILSKSSKASQDENMIAIKNMFESDLVGELSVSTNTVHFRRKDFDWIVDSKYFMSAPKTFEKHFSRVSIVDAFIRLERVEIDRPEFEFVIFYGQPEGSIERSKEDKNVLVSFKKTLSKEELEQGFFEKNLEITHSFRINYKPNSRLFLTVSTLPGVKFDFESVQLIVYTKV